MTPATFKRIREKREWSVNDCARYLRVSSRSVRYWEDGEREIPGPVEVLMEQAQQQTESPHP